MLCSLVPRRIGLRTFRENVQLSLWMNIGPVLSSCLLCLFVSSFEAVLQFPARLVYLFIARSQRQRTHLKSASSKIRAVSIQPRTALALEGGVIISILQKMQSRSVCTSGDPVRVRAKHVFKRFSLVSSRTVRRCWSNTFWLPR